MGSRGNQNGFVSIIVTVVMTVVMTMIVVSFSQFTRREQTQVLDRQLNNQAYYAAETGVNDAVELLKSGVVNSATDYSTDCNRFIYEYLAPSSRNVLDNGEGNLITYSCLLVDAEPDYLEYGNVTNSSTVLPIRTRQPLNRITISWQDKDGSTDVSNCTTPKNQWPQAPSWLCPFGVLRVDLIRLDSGAAAQNVLVNSLMTAFLVPSRSTGEDVSFSTNRGYAGAGGTYYARCTNAAPTEDAPKRCTAQITGIDGGNYYLMRIRSIYKNSTVTVMGRNSGGTKQGLYGAQAMVDSTGKANDILRRIQVRVPIFDPGPVADFALQSVTDICKQLIVLPNRVSSPEPTCLAP